MSENSRKLQYNKIYHRGDFDATFKWTIPNISSLPHKVDFVVRSPTFPYEGASWIFKMYPCGRSSYSEGYIDFGIERLHSEIEKHVVFCKIYCENNFNTDFNSSGRYIFNSTQTEVKVSRVMQNLKEFPVKWQLTPNDVFTVLFAFNKEDVVVSKIKSGETAIGKKFAASRNPECQEIGEVFKDYYKFRCFLWKICSLPSFILPVDYHLDSPTFSFANAKWILKLYPYFRKTQSRNPNLGVMLQRLHSEVPEHRVTLRMCMDRPTRYDATGFSFFDVHHTHGNVLTFRLREKDIPKDTLLNCLHFDVNISVDNILMKDVRTEIDSLAKFSKPRVDDSGSSVVHQYNKVLRDYKKLLQQQEDCDVIIKVKGVEFPAHRIILKVRSPVFASTLRIDMKGKATGVIDVEDCDPSTFSDFLSFLYCGELESLSEDSVFSLFTAADKYNVTELRTMCLEFIKENLSVDTFCDTIALALKHSEAELIKLSTDFFAKNLREIIVTVKWRSFIVENPIQGNELMIKALVPSKNKNTNS